MDAQLRKAARACESQERFTTQAADSITGTLVRIDTASKAMAVGWAITCLRWM
jgi:hypothetical protein